MQQLNPLRALVNTKAFRAALVTLAKIAPNRLIPHATLQADPEGASLSIALPGARLRVSLPGARPLDGADGVAIVPMDRIANILKSTKGEDVSVEQLEDEKHGPVFRVRTIEPKHGITGTFNLTTKAPSAEDSAPPPSAESFWYVAADDLMQALARVKPAIGDSTRYPLEGALIEAEESRLTLVATDASWMAMQAIIARRQGTGALPFADGYRPILPEGAFRVLGDLCKSAGAEHVQVCFFDQDNPNGYPARTRWANFRFADSGAELSVRLADGTFPDYQEVAFPDTLESIAEMQTADLARAVKSAQLGTAPGTPGVIFRAECTGSGSALTLEATSADLGLVSAQVYASVSHGTFELTLDPRYVLDMLKALGKDVTSIRLKTSGPSTAVVWTTRDGFTAPMMPIFKDEPAPAPEPTAEEVQAEEMSRAWPLALEAGDVAVWTGPESGEECRWHVVGPHPHGPGCYMARPEMAWGALGEAVCIDPRGSAWSLALPALCGGSPEAEEAPTPHAATPRPDFPETPWYVDAGISAYRAGGQYEADRFYFAQVGTERRGELDRFLMAIEHPSTFVPGSNLDRFLALVRECAEGCPVSFEAPTATAEETPRAEIPAEATAPSFPDPKITARHIERMNWNQGVPHADRWYARFLALLARHPGNVALLAIHRNLLKLDVWHMAEKRHAERQATPPAKPKRTRKPRTRKPKAEVKHPTEYVARALDPARMPALGDRYASDCGNVFRVTALLDECHYHVVREGNSFDKDQPYTWIPGALDGMVKLDPAPDPDPDFREDAPAEAPAPIAGGAPVAKAEVEVEVEVEAIAPPPGFSGHKSTPQVQIERIIVKAHYQRARLCHRNQANTIQYKGRIETLDDAEADRISARRRAIAGRSHAIGLRRDEIAMGMTPGEYGAKLPTFARVEAPDDAPTVTIAGKPYAYEAFSGPDGFRVVRLTKADGTTYDVAEGAERTTCDCPDWRKRHADLPYSNGCKHVRTLAEAGLIEHRLPPSGVFGTSEPVTSPTSADTMTDGRETVNPAPALVTPALVGEPTCPPSSLPSPSSTAESPGSPATESGTTGRSRDAETTAESPPTTGTSSSCRDAGHTSPSDSGQPPKRSTSTRPCIDSSSPSSSAPALPGCKPVTTTVTPPTTVLTIYGGTHPRTTWPTARGTGERDGAQEAAKRSSSSRTSRKSDASQPEASTCEQSRNGSESPGKPSSTSSEGRPGDTSPDAPPSGIFRGLGDVCTPTNNLTCDAGAPAIGLQALVIACHGHTRPMGVEVAAHAQDASWALLGAIAELRDDREEPGGTEPPPDGPEDAGFPGISREEQDGTPGAVFGEGPRRGRLSLLQLVEAEASRFLARRNAAGRLLAEALHRLAEDIRWTRAETPWEHESRLELWSAWVEDNEPAEAF